MKAGNLTIALHQGDLPAGLAFADSVAVDTETQGLNLARDRLCLAQVAGGDGVCHLVRFAPGAYDAPNLKRVLADRAILKIFHFARFDLAAFTRYLGVTCEPVYCTKIASRLVRTYTDRHGLKDLCRELLGLDLDKEQQSSDWGAATLTPEQQRYAATDVAHLHALRAALDAMLEREGRAELAEACFRFLSVRVRLDAGGWDEPDIFSH